MERKRIEWLDIAKGLGIILVMIGHCLSSDLRDNSSAANCVYSVIYYFHMSFMFYISGRVYSLSVEKYKNMNCGSFLMKRFRSYIVPYISYSYSVYLIFYIFTRVPSIRNMLKDSNYIVGNLYLHTKNTILGYNPQSLHLWYLYVLFLVSMLAFFVYKAVSKKSIANTIMLTCAIIAYVVLNREFIYNYSFGFFMLGRMMLWFVIGLAVDFSKISILKVAIYDVLIIGVNFVSIDNPIIASIIKVFSIAAIIVTLVQLCNFLDRSKKINRLRIIGKDSMVYYIFHQPFCATILSMVLYRVFNGNIIFSFVVAFATCLIVPRLLLIVIEKYHMNVIKKLYLGK